MDAFKYKKACLLFLWGAGSRSVCDLGDCMQIVVMGKEKGYVYNNIVYNWWRVKYTMNFTARGWLWFAW